jgi:NADH-quinone oxidoreductase subunit H
VFFTISVVVIFVFMWVRWSLPRFRFDQLMMLAWRALIPISLALLLMTAIIMTMFHGNVTDGPGAAALLAANIIVMIAVGIISTWLPAAPATNRKLKVLGSRYSKTPLPAELN